MARKQLRYVLMVHLVDSETYKPYKRYITGIDRRTWTADLGKEAEEFDRTRAEDIARGCALNLIRCDVLLKVDWLTYVNPTKYEIEQGKEL